MKKCIIVICASAVVIAGCKSIKFAKTERTPYVVGTNVVAVTERAVEGSYYAYGLENNLEGLEVSASPTNGIAVKINRVSYDMSKQHAYIVDKSLSGAAELAGKIGAAIATAGGSATGDVIAGYVKQFIDKGGDISKATVTVSDDKVTCTDGSCFVTGSCSEGVCSPL